MTAKVARIDQPKPGLLCFTIGTGRETEVLLLSILPNALGVGIVQNRPRGADAEESVSQLRRHLVGGTIDQILQSRHYVRFCVVRDEGATILTGHAHKPRGGWWLEGSGGAVIVRSPGAKPKPVPECERFEARDLNGLRTTGTDVLNAHAAAQVQQLRRLLGAQRARLERKRRAISNDLQKTERADELHEHATLLLTYSGAIPPGASEFEARTWETNPRTVLIPLDPTRTPPEQAQDLFRKAKRLKRGLEVAPARLRETTTQLQALDAIEAMIGGESPEAIAAKMTEFGFPTESREATSARIRKDGGRRPYREFEAADGTRILVGRSAADNDRLTRRVAKPQDLWLHARGVTGAHVVVQLAKGTSCSPETLVDAATLAAHFSELRADAIVDVLHTPRRFVHKRRGSPVGSVTLDREKVIAVRLEPARIARLLEGERRP